MCPLSFGPPPTLVLTPAVTGTWFFDFYRVFQKLLFFFPPPSHKGDIPPFILGSVMNNIFSLSVASFSPFFFFSVSIVTWRPSLMFFFLLLFLVLFPQASGFDVEVFLFSSIFFSLPIYFFSSPQFPFPTYPLLFPFSLLSHCTWIVGCLALFFCLSASPQGVSPQ